MAVYRIAGLHPPGHPLTAAVLRKTIKETIRLYSSDVSRSLVTGLPYEIWQKMVSFTFVTPWCRIVLETLIVSQLTKKIRAFYAPKRFVTLFTTACYLSLSSGRPIQSAPSNPISWKPTLISSSHLRLGFPSDIYPSRSPNKSLYAPVLFFMFVTHR